MPRKLVGGLIPCSNPINDDSVAVENRVPSTRLGSRP